MSAEQYRQSIIRRQNEIAAVQQKKAAESKKAADFIGKVARATESARRSTSASSQASKVRDIERYQRDLANTEKKVADFEKKIGQLQSQMADDQRRLADEERRDSSKRELADQQRVREHTAKMAGVASTLRQHERLHQATQATLNRLAEPPERLVVLFLASNPLDQAFLRLDEEARAIAQMIRSSKHRDVVRLESCWALQSRDLLQALNEFQPAIVHFSGHGTDSDEIVFQTPAGLSKPVSKEAIVQVRRTVSDGLRLVFFNTCHSHRQAEAVVEFVDAAIGMNTTIGDDAARIFSSTFYSAIGFGLTLQKASDQARAALMLEGIDEAQTPMLYVQPGLDAAGITLVAA